jgi:hypothetical protein
MGQPFDDLYPCTDSPQNSPTYHLDTYTISPALIDATGAVIDQAAPITISLTTNNQIADLPMVTFNAGPSSQDVAFSVDYGAAGGKNCDSTAMGGNGVAQQQIDLYDTGSATCLALVITGTDQTGQPISDTTCTPGLCDETTVIETIKNVPEGDYTLVVHGLKNNAGAAAADCYDGHMSFHVPVAGGDLGTIAAPFCPDPTTPDCTSSCSLKPTVPR